MGVASDQRRRGSKNGGGGLGRNDGSRNKGSGVESEDMGSRSGLGLKVGAGGEGFGLGADWGAAEEAAMAAASISGGGRGGGSGGGGKSERRKLACGMCGSLRFPEDVSFRMTAKMVRETLFHVSSGGGLIGSTREGRVATVSCLCWKRHARFCYPAYLVVFFVALLMAELG